MTRTVTLFPSTSLFRSNRIPAGKPAAGLKTGGASAFLDFLQRSVMPVIEARWHIDRRRETLVGHSFGGLLGVHAWLTRPALFDHVVVASPSFRSERRRGGNECVSTCNSRGPP